MTKKRVFSPEDVSRYSSENNRARSLASGIEYTRDESSFAGLAKSMSEQGDDNSTPIKEVTPVENKDQTFLEKIGSGAKDLMIEAYEWPKDMAVGLATGWFPDAFKSFSNGVDTAHISGNDGYIRNHVSRAIKGLELASDAAKNDPSFFTAIKLYNDWNSNPNKKSDNVGMPTEDQIPSGLKPIWDKHKETIYLYNKAKSEFDDNDTEKKIKEYNGSPSGFSPSGAIAVGMDKANPSAKLPKLPSLYEILNSGFGTDIASSDGYANAMNNIKTKVDNIHKDTEWHKKDIEDRGESSDYYKQKESKGDFMYSMPGQIGISSGDALAQYGAIGVNRVILTAAMKTKNPYVIAGAGVAALLVDYNASRYQRDRENAMELSDAHDAKINQGLGVTLDMNGKTVISSNVNTLESQTDSALLQQIVPAPSVDKDIFYKAQDELKANGKLSDGTRTSVISGLKGRTLISSDSRFNKALAGADKYVDEYMQRDDAYMYSDMIETGLLSIPFGSAVRTGYKAIEAVEAASSIEKIGASILKPAVKTLDYTAKYYENTIAKIVKSKPWRVADIIRAPIIDALGESWEEGGQHVNSQQYISNYNEYQNSSYLNSLIDGQKAALLGARITLGENVDHKYVDRDQLFLNQKAGFQMGLVMGAPQSIIEAVKTVSDISKEVKAKKYIKGSLSEILDSETRINKSAVYVDSKTKGKSEQIIQQLEKLSKNPPEGTTKEQFEEEIKTAKETFAIADSPTVLAYAKANGKYGSEDHKLLTGLIMDHSRSLAVAMKAVYENAAILENSSKLDHKNDIPFNTKFEEINHGKEVKVSPVDQEELHKAISELNASKDILKAKIATDENAKSVGDKTILAMPNVVVKNELSFRIKQLESYINDKSESLGITKEELESIPTPSISYESRDALATIITSQAGLRYDGRMINALSGYESIRNAKSGKIETKKMDKDTHEELVSKYLNKYRTSRESERQTQENAENREEDTKVKNEEHDFVSTASVPHPGEKVEPAEPVLETPANDILSKKDDIEARRKEELDNNYKNYNPEHPEYNGEEHFNADKVINDKYDSELKTVFDESIDESKLTPVEKTKWKLLNRYPDGPKEEMDTKKANFISNLEYKQTENKPILSPSKPSSPVVDTNISNPTESVLNKPAEAFTPVVEPNNEDDEFDTAINALDRLKKANENVIIPGESTSITSKDSDKAIESNDINNAPEIDTDKVKENPNNETLIDPKSNNGDTYNPDDASSQTNSVIENKQAEESLVEEDAYAKEKLEVETADYANTLLFSHKNKSTSVPGFRSSYDLGELLRTNDAMSNCEVEFVNFKKGDVDLYNPNDIDNTHQYTSVYAVITKKDGPFAGKYLAPMRDPSFVSSITYAAPTQMQLDRTVSLKKQILSMLNSASIETRKDGVERKVVATTIKFTDGRIDVLRENTKNKDGKYNSIQRPIGEIPGFDLPMQDGKVQWDKIGGTTELNIAKGDVANRVVMDLTQQMVGQTTKESNTGNIYIYVPGNISGIPKPIKVNQKQFSREDDSVAELIYDLAINSLGSIENKIYIDKNGNRTKNTTGSIDSGMNAFGLLNRMVRFGNDTKRNSDDPSEVKDFLVRKQFYIDNGPNDELIVVYGNKSMLIKDAMTTGKTELIDYIKNNYHWNIEKTDLANQVTRVGKTVKDLFPRINELFAYGDQLKSDKVEFAKGISISKDDMNLTWLAWLMKNGKILSDATDQVFTPPFTHLSDFETITAESSPKILTNDGRTSDVVANTNIIAEGITPTENTKATPSPTGETTGVKTFADLAPKPKKRGGSNAVIPSMIKNRIDKVMDVKSETEWLISKLGLSNNEIDIADQIIQLSGDKQAMGVMRESAITLWKGAEEGTAYHEAYHRVSLLLLTRAERQSMYSSARDSYKEIKNASDKVVEEFLAEKFREYVIANNMPNIFPNRVKAGFRKLYNLISRLFKLNNKDLNRLFKDINLGVFKGYNINENSLREFKEQYGDEATYGYKDLNLKTISTYNELFSVRDALTYYLFKLNDISKIEDINKIDFDVLKNTIEASIVNETDDKRKSVYTEILERFDDVFKPKIKQALSMMNIVETENDDVQTLGNEIASHIKASYEISKKDNIRAGVKMFIATMHDTYFENDYVVPVFDSLTGLPKFVPFDYSWNRMISELSDSSTVESMIDKVKDLGKNNSFYSTLFDRLSNKDESEGPVMSDNFITQFWNTMFSMRHQFVNIGYKEMLESADDVKSKFFIRDSDVDKATKELPRVWGQNFYENELIYSINENEEKVFNSKYLQSIVNRYNTGILGDYRKMPRNENSFITKINGISAKIDLNTYEGRESVISEIVDLYNSVGVVIDNDTINYFINNSNEDSAKTIKNLADYILNQKSGSMKNLFVDILPKLISDNGELKIKTKKGKEKLSDVKRIFFGEGFSEKLAYAYSKSHPTPEEVMVLGADGAKLYQVSSNNYISDTVRNIRTSSAEVDNLLKATYTAGRNLAGMFTGSRLLNQIKSGSSKGIELKTFVKLYEEGSGDKGRDYLDISPAEDYVMKMSAMANDYMVLPTMADAKTYNFISGATLIHEPVVVNVTKNGDKNVISIDFGNERRTQYANYFEAEFMAIEDAWTEYKKQNGDSRKLIDTYHVNPKWDSTKPWAERHGNGLRFRHFGVVNGTFNLAGTISSNMYNLNSYLNKTTSAAEMDAALNNIRKTLIEDRATLYETMNSTLRVALDDELKYAAEIGVIKYDGENYSSLRNDLIDRGSFNNNALNYKDSLYSKTMGKYNEVASVINMITEGMTNEHISVIEFEKIFSKDPAYYSNADAKIKRLRSLLSTGTNLRTDFTTNHPMNGITRFNVSEMLDNLVGSAEYEKIKSIFLANEINISLASHNKPKINNLRELIENSFKPELERNLEQFQELTKLNSEFREEFLIGTKLAKVSHIGYDKGNINETDATVYVSPEMYKNILHMLGEWSPEMQESYDLLESEDQSWMNDDELYNKVISLSMKPLKMIYFGSEVNAETKLDVPKLDKMAMFPLFKALSNGDLKPLYDRMNNPGPTMDKIHMIPFNSAVKVNNNNNGFKYYTDENQNQISDLSNMTFDSQQYKYLRRQLLTDPHHSATLTSGTQFIKGAMSNIIRGNEYENIVMNGKKGVTGSDLINAWTSAINSLSNRGVTSLKNELGMISDENGNMSFDKGKLSKLLTEDAENSKMPDDVIRKLSDSSKDGKVELQALWDDSWIESRLVSMITKKVVNISTPGGMFIQMTPFGQKSSERQALNSGNITQDQYDANNGGKYIINNGNRLRFVNDDGSMDAAVSINLFKDVIPDRLKNKSFAKQKAWLVENNIIGDNSAPSAIGYRIPTQGLSSISGLKIVDVMPANIADTIILPTEFTRLTGSDFDIDKLFLARYNYSGVKKINFSDDTNSTIEDRIKTARAEETLTQVKDEIKKHKKDLLDSEINDNLDNLINELKLKDKIKSIKDKWDSENVNFSERDMYSQNSSAAVQNRLLDVFMATITNPNSMHETRMPLDTVTDALKGKGGILEDIESLSTKFTGLKPFEFISMAYQSRKKEEYGTGKGGIPSFALNNAHHVLTQIAELNFKGLGPIKKFGMQSVHGVYGIDGVRVLDWLSAMINAHVDIAKDPYIIRLNVNGFTYGMTNFLLRTGKGSDTFYFLSQPVLKEAAKEARMVEGKYGIDNNISSEEYRQFIINQLRKKYTNIATDAIRSNGDKGGVNKKMLNSLLNDKDNKNRRIIPNNKVFNGKRDANNRNKFLRDQFSLGNTSFEYAYNQLLILETFEEMHPFAKKLMELVKNSQVDNSKYGQTFASIRAYNNNIEEIKSLGLNSVFENVDDLFSKTFLDAKMKNVYDMSRAIGNGMFFRTTEPVSKLIEQISALTANSKMVNEDTVRTISNTIDSKLKSEFYINLANERGVSIENLFYGKDTMARRLYRIKNKITQGDADFVLLKNNMFINKIKAEIADESKDPYMKMPDHIGVVDAVSTSDSNVITQIKEYHSELLDSPVKELSDFAKDFILYQFFSNGENAAFNAVKVSEDVREDMGYYKFISGKLRELRNAEDAYTNTNDAIRDIIINKWYDDSIVPVAPLFKNRGFISSGTTTTPDIYIAPQIPSAVEFAKGKTHPLMFINEYAKKIGVNKNKESMFVPFTKLRFTDDNGNSQFVLYELKGVVRNSTEDKPITYPVYTAIDKKGYKKSGRSVIELNMDQSMIPSNIIKKGGKFSPATFDSAESMRKNILGAFNYYNNQIASKTIQGEQIERINMDILADKFKSFVPISEYEMPIEDEQEVNTINSEDNIINTVNSSINNALKSGVYNTNELMSELNSRDADPNEIKAALYKYGSMLKTSLLSDLNDSIDNLDQVTQLEEIVAKTTLKMRVEAYSDALMKENEGFKNYFEEDQAIFDKINEDTSWNDSKNAIEFQEEKSSTPSEIIVNTEFKSINDGLKSIGIEPISQEDYNNMSQEELDKLKACYGA